MPRKRTPPLNTSAGPNILEELIELDDVGVVHHFHDGKLLTSRSKGQQQKHQLTTTSKLTILPKNMQQYRNILLEALDVLHRCFGNGIHPPMAWRSGSVTSGHEKSPGCSRRIAFVEMLVALERNHAIPHPSSSCPRG